MSDAVKVNIERGTERRRIILSALCEVVFADLRGVDPKKFEEIEDWEIENVMQTLDPSEKLLVGRKYLYTFTKNVDAALARMYKPLTVKVARIASRGILGDIKPNEVGVNTTPIDPNKGN